MIIKYFFIILYLIGTMSVYSYRMSEKFVGTTTIQIKNDGNSKLMIFPDGKIIKLPRNEGNVTIEKEKR